MDNLMKLIQGDPQNLRGSATLYTQVAGGEQLTNSPTPQEGRMFYYVALDAALYGIKTGRWTRKLSDIETADAHIKALEALLLKHPDVPLPHPFSFYGTVIYQPPENFLNGDEDDVIEVGTGQIFHPAQAPDALACAAHLYAAVCRAQRFQEKPRPQLPEAIPLLDLGTYVVDVYLSTMLRERPASKHRVEFRKSLLEFMRDYGKGEHVTILTAAADFALNAPSNAQSVKIVDAFGQQVTALLAKDLSAAARHEAFIKEALAKK